ncbi:hypothetical protein [Vibrio natriegens]|uniref:hypothetical protein n=1 Tax=Vibrio natriegens TaxID=691 RepID=UPI0008047763|nr:hypothetical protein [Vibrio natriegens]ANQ19622.1 hypothetical protein BA891_20900 [Vibrio natriegens]
MKRSLIYTCVLSSLMMLAGCSSTKNNLSMKPTEPPAPVVPQTAEIERDKFTGKFTIRTHYKDGMMFRAWGDNVSNKLVSDQVQLYADVLCWGEYCSLDSSYDENSNERKLMPIASDVDCSLVKYTGDESSCKITETIGIDIPVSYLKQKRNGFEIKVMGRKSAIIKVSGDQVRQILEGIEPFI